MAKDLIEDLKKGLCLVTYRSLNSNKENEFEATLMPEHIHNNTTLNQRDDTDKILMYNCTFEKWEDIDADTIVRWIKL